MFHGRKSYWDEEFIKLFQGRLLCNFPAEERTLVLAIQVENLPFHVAAKYKNFLSGPVTNCHGKISIPCFSFLELCVNIREHNGSKIFICHSFIQQLKAYCVLDIMLYTSTPHTKLNAYRCLFSRKSWAMLCQWFRPSLPNKKKCNRKLNSFNRRSGENPEKLKLSECLTKNWPKANT